MATAWHWKFGTFLLVAGSIFGADWNPRLAATYLDSRQKDWFAWTPAKAPGGPCVSCHTGVTYLLARPALRRALGESRPTEYETGLLEALRARVDKKESKEVFPSFTKEPAAAQAMGVESIHAALFLGTEEAFTRLWSLQIRDGESKGAWNWFSLNLDPWEMPESRFYGAAMAALAAGNSPAAQNREGIQALAAYLQRELKNQPLHNRAVLLWTSTKLPQALPETARKAIIEEIREKQRSDGGWTLASLGPWKQHAAAPADEGSNSYATALIAFALQKAGVPASDVRLKRAIGWLAAHQDRESGMWSSSSMNKRFEPGSMQILFMNDAATAFASVALLESRSH
jgi:squalene-hopene/tetraprenyl-beta-curcumene cyclase